MGSQNEVEKVVRPLISALLEFTRTRPHPWSTTHDYTTWQGLTDKTYLARHLPPRHLTHLPPVENVMELFKRPEGRARLSARSTCLFAAFAQYLTDGFIRTHPEDPRRTTSNHDIDLCPLYGRTAAQTHALRLNSNRRTRRGRLKSQIVNSEEWAPFLYPDGRTADSQFDQLDKPLFGHGEPPPPPHQLVAIFAFGGDRVNSTPYTAMMNTLLLREHNRIAGELERRNSSWDDERVFQTARNILIVLFLKLVIEEYIGGHILGEPLPFSAAVKVAQKAKWNRPNWITVEFSLLYRWHSLVPDEIEWPERIISLDEFQMNNRLLLSVGLDEAFAAASRQMAGDICSFNTSTGLIGLEARAIAQARFNRIQSLNSYRKAFNLPPFTTFDSFAPGTATLLKDLYNEPDNIEFYPGLFAEPLADTDGARSPLLPGLMGRMVAVDAFSQALTNPLLSQHVFTQDSFSQYGAELINAPCTLAILLERNVPKRGCVPITMTHRTDK